MDKQLIAPARRLPADWTSHPAGPASQNHGAAWLKASRFAALKVPSSVIPEETNLLLNPLAPEFDSIRVVEEKPFRLDLRLG